MPTFPKYFKHAPIGHQYQIAIVMSEESAIGVLLTFQGEVFDYNPGDTETQNVLFHYQPDVLINAATVVLPPLTELRHSPEWFEGKMSWENDRHDWNLISVTGAPAPTFSPSTDTISVLTADGERAVAEADAAPTNLFFV